MTDAAPRTRPTGATALMPPRAQPRIVSATGGGLDLSNHVREPGFSPVDLLYGAVAGCIALSARAAAHQLGVLDRLLDVRVQVSGRKAVDGPSRVERFDISISIDGDLDETTKRQIAERAEGELCTVSNTLRGGPVLAASLSTAREGHD
jgi:uncharacterized OsmC-like protein